MAEGPTTPVPSILILSTADTDLLTVGHALASLPYDFPPVRAANPATITTAEEADRFLDRELPGTGVVVARLLGGKRAFDAGWERLTRTCRERSIPLVAIPGDQAPDLDLQASCTAGPEVVQRVFEYLMHGGVENAANLLCFLADAALGTDYGAGEPCAVAWEGVYHPDEPDGLSVEEYLSRRGADGRPVVAVLFYRAHWMSRNLGFVDALLRGLEAEACTPLPIFCYSLKDGTAGVPAVFRDYLMRSDGATRVDAVLNTLSFAMSQVEVKGVAVASGWSVEALDRLDVPVFQAIVSTSTADQWAGSQSGLSPIDTAMNVAMPEFDGRIIGVPISFKQEAVEDQRLGAKLMRYAPMPDRVAFMAALAASWARLRRTPNAEKRVALVLSNYPTRNARIGNAVGLDTPASVLHILEALRDDGYTVGDLPESGDALIHQLIDRCSYDREFLTEAQMAGAPARVADGAYRRQFDRFTPAVQQQLRDAWGEPPGEVYRDGDALVVPGLRFGNVFVGIQPPRGFGENPIAIYHSPDLTPTHHYLAYYGWLREQFGAHAILHIGKHGTLEWLPGKSLGLSASCYPDVALGPAPHFYPFIVNNPGEGAQAKRRAHAAIVDHLIPAMTTADGYNEIVQLEQLMDEYYQVQTLDPKKAPLVRDQIWQLITEAKLHHDLHQSDRPGEDDFDTFLLHVDGYICELKDAQIRDGLHTLGQPPTGEQEVGLLLALTRLDNVEASSLRRVLAGALGLDYDSLTADRGAVVSGLVPDALTRIDDGSPIRSHGDVIERLDRLGHHLVAELQARGFAPDAVPSIVEPWFPSDGLAVQETLGYVAATLAPSLARTTDEIANLLRGLRGGYIPAGPSGAPTRGQANALPTGRNFYSVDPNTIPSPNAWETGKALGEALLQKYLAEEGRYPESVGIVVWGTSAMRTHGDDIAEILYLLGVRPVWQRENRRVRGIELIPLEELGRPRIDVTARISGFFRDAFPNLIHLIDDAIRLVAELDEPADQNYLAARVRADAVRKEAAGLDRASAWRAASYRVFGSKPGTYGAGILPLLDERNWTTDRDLANVYQAWGAFAYGRGVFGTNAPEEFRERFGSIVVAAKNQDNREHDIFDSDDYLQYHGGMIATVRALSGADPKQYFGDSSNPLEPKQRDLSDEARRVFRSRVVNPKWIAGIKRHGYKGAFEMAATVDYLYGYDATAHVVEDWMYERVTDAYVFDQDTRAFFEEKNPWALRGIVERLVEAMDRGLWEAPDDETRRRLQQVYLDVEGQIEARAEGEDA
ncbi:MAG: cobaltochelatase subunit CobN [Chloroflexi bacterium]|nr:cobaltochelatase subunit CobN [Chloroflexota bacterium]